MFSRRDLCQSSLKWNATFWLTLTLYPIRCIDSWHLWRLKFLFFFLFLSVKCLNNFPIICFLIWLLVVFSYTFIIKYTIILLSLSIRRVKSIRRWYNCLVFCLHFAQKVLSDIFRIGFSLVLSKVPFRASCLHCVFGWGRVWHELKGTIIYVFAWVQCVSVWRCFGSRFGSCFRSCLGRRDAAAGTRRLSVGSTVSFNWGYG